jgi:hypothetical protein
MFNSFHSLHSKSDEHNNVTSQSHHLLSPTVVLWFILFVTFLVRLSLLFKTNLPVVSQILFYLLIYFPVVVVAVMMVVVTVTVAMMMMNVTVTWVALLLPIQKSLDQISTHRLAILTEVSPGFLKSLQANVRTTSFHTFF